MNDIERLKETFKVLNAQVDELEDMGFGNAAATITRTVSELEHFAEEDFDLKAARAVRAYLLHELERMPAPDVAFCYTPSDSITARFSIPVEPSFVAWVSKWDPGHPLDRDCPTCHCGKRNACTGDKPKGLGFHAARMKRGS